MVVEYMCHGDLLGFLRGSRGHHGMYTVSPGINNQPPCLNLSSRDLLSVAAKIANGMRFLADRKVRECKTHYIIWNAVGTVIILRCTNVSSDSFLDV